MYSKKTTYATLHCWKKSINSWMRCIKKNKSPVMQTGLTRWPNSKICWEECSLLIRKEWGRQMKNMKWQTWWNNLAKCFKMRIYIMKAKKVVLPILTIAICSTTWQMSCSISSWTKKYYWSLCSRPNRAMRLILNLLES